MTETNNTEGAGAAGSTTDQTAAAATTDQAAADVTRIPPDPVPAPPIVTPPATSAKVTMNVDSGIKHVKLIIDDTAVLAEIGAGLVGQPEVATGIAAIVRLADAALQGAADADVIVINDENIVALLSNVTLDKPTS